MSKDLNKLKREIQAFKRDIRKKILGIEDSENALMRNYTEATKTRRAIKTELFGNKSKQVDTSIEIFVENILKERNIKYIPQKAIRWCNYDFYLINENLLIECQGCYWHCCELCYPAGPKNEIQRKNLEKNIMKREIAASQNIPMLEIWAHEIKNDPEQTKQKIDIFILENSSEIST